MGIFDFFKKKPLSIKETQYTSQKEKNGDTSLNKYGIPIDPVLKKKLRCGLLPGEIVLLDWMKGKSANANFPQYFTGVYGLDVNSSIKKLVKKDLLTLQSPTDSLNSLKVTDLKEILKEHGLKSTGNKKVLVDTLCTNLSDEQIEERVPDKFYTPSIDGEALINEYSYIIWTKQNDSKDGTVNVASMIMEMEKSDFKNTPQEVAWSLLQKAHVQNLKDKNYGLARNSQSSMARYLEKENKDLQALHHYIKVTQYDMSGLNNGDYISHPKYLMVISGIFDRINKIIFELELSEQQLRSIFNQVWDETMKELPFHYLNREIAFECFQAAREDKEDYVEKVLLSSYKKQPASIKNKVIDID